ncbi:hypothetical protein F2Q69_00035137 [Brassica cretica]|uniref:Uncharacterized protein n=1 Tax=Brassica cretica TaxID=69181 RepID=A0A8S9SEJ9_BRACR|nr:hypothetical protein F2Q69_00035137 [Brassica cretica]
MCPSESLKIKTLDVSFIVIFASLSKISPISLSLTVTPAICELPSPVIPLPTVRSLPPLHKSSAQEDPGVMSVQQLVQQPGREHLPVLHPNPRPGHTTWFDKSSNGISRSINNMMYSMLHTGYSKWSVIPREDRELWFRQFADAMIRSVVDLVETQKEDLLSSQPLSDDGDSTGGSTNMKGGRLVGLARRASSYPASSSQVPYTDPMILKLLQNKDERIVALEEQNATILFENATILAQLESQKKTNAEILEKLDRLLP